MAFDASLGGTGRTSASYRVARGVLELFVDSTAADRRLDRFFNDTDRGMTASAQRAARLFALNFTRGADGIIRDSMGRIIDPNDPRLVISGRRAGNRFFRAFFNQSRGGAQRFFDGLFGGASNLPGLGWVTAFQKIPPEVQAAIAAGLAGAIYAGGALIGAALDAVILAAIGGGVMAVGIISAVKDPAVKAAFGGVGDELSDIFKSMGEPFIEPLIGAAQEFKALFLVVEPGFKRMAKTVSVLVQPFADGISDLVENLMPGLESAVTASVPVLRELADDLPSLGDAFNEMFGSIAAGDGAVKGMRFIMRLLSGSLIAVGDTVEFLSNQFDDLTNNIETFFQIGSHIPGIGRWFEAGAEGMHNFNNTSGEMVGMLGLTDKGMEEVARSTSAAGRAAEDLKNHWGDLWGQAMTLDGALIAYQASLDALTASFKENGKTLDIGTEKGRNNAEALLAVAENAKAVRDAEAQIPGNVDAANLKFQRQIEALRAAAFAAGFNKDQVEALLQKYQAYANAAPVVNKTITTTIKTVYITEGRPGPAGNVRSFNRWGGVTAAQQGLLSAGIFGASSHPLVQFAEPETGGEAFIPRRGNQTRNLAILRTAADWNNADVVPRAPGVSTIPMAGEVGARSRQARGGAAGGQNGTFGPYVIQVADKVLAAFVVDVVTGMPKQIAALADEGRRRTNFANPSVGR